MSDYVQAMKELWRAIHKADVEAELRDPAGLRIVVSVTVMARAWLSFAESNPAGLETEIAEARWCLEPLKMTKELESLCEESLAEHYVGRSEEALPSGDRCKACGRPSATDKDWSAMHDHEADCCDDRCGFMDSVCFGESHGCARFAQSAHGSAFEWCGLVEEATADRECLFCLWPIAAGSLVRVTPEPAGDPCRAYAHIDCWTFNSGQPPTYTPIGPITAREAAMIAQALASKATPYARLMAATEAPPSSSPGNP